MAVGEGLPLAASHATMVGPQGEGAVLLPSEEYLRQVTVGEVAVHNGTIRLEPYNPAWPAQFAIQAERIQKALGEKALMVEHVGSTAVPGLWAKPILDILLLVDDPSREADYLPALEQAGYPLRVREPDWFQHRMCKGGDPVVNLHIFGWGCPEANRMLAFRDWLRAHPEDRGRYARVKQELAARRWTYVQEYADAKSQVVSEILERAGARVESKPALAVPPIPGSTPLKTPGSEG